MRKWVRIAAAVVLVFAVFVVPWSETELHKARCEAAWRKFQGKSFAQQVKTACYKIIGATPPVSESSGDDWWQLSETRQALIEVGFLSQEQFVLKNGAAKAEEGFYRERPENAFRWVEWHWHSSNILVVTTRKSEMAAVCNIIRRLDERAE